MNQIRPFPPTELLDQAEEEAAIRLAPAPDLNEWVIANISLLKLSFITPTMIILLICYMTMKSS